MNIILSRGTQKREPLSNPNVLRRMGYIALSDSDIGKKFTYESKTSGRGSHVPFGEYLGIVTEND